MRLIEYEQTIKDLVKKDRNNPEIYSLLQEMILMFLRRKKSPGGPQEVEEVSYTMAGDIYLKIINGEDINYFLGYFDKKYKEYFKDYYESGRYTEPYDPSINDKEVLRRSSGSQEFSKVINKLYLKDIGKIVDKVMEKSCKYKYQSKEYLNLKLSLMISILRNTKFEFHLNQEQSFYLKLLIVAFYEEVKKEGLGFNCEESF